MEISSDGKDPTLVTMLKDGFLYSPVSPQGCGEGETGSHPVTGFQSICRMCFSKEGSRFYEKYVLLFLLYYIFKINHRCRKKMDDK